MKETTSTETIVIKSPLPFYAAGTTALLFALIVPMATWFSLIGFILVTAGVFALTEKLAPKKTKVIEVKEEPKSTGNPETDRLLYEGRLTLEKIRDANERIADPLLTEKIHRMEQLTDSILSRVEEKPEKAPEIRRFSDYYLPTTLKMLEHYISMKQSGANLGETLEKIEGAVDRILEAFRKQLDNLYEEEAMDISTDIDVFETMLVRQGLVDPEEKMTMGGH